MIVIQQINSRAQEPAFAGPDLGRSGVPETVAIPDHYRRQAHGDSLQQLYRCSAPVGGTRPYEQVIVRDTTRLTIAGAVMVSLDGEILRVSFAYSPECGAPSRPWAVKQFELRPGEWVQIAYNGRFSSGSEYDYSRESSRWWYEKTVVNVGLFDAATTDLFTRGDPTERYTLYSELW